MDFFNFTLGLSLAICLTGIVYRMRGWFRFAPQQRSNISAACRSFSAALLNHPETVGKNIFQWIKSLLLDTLLQWHLFKKSPMRWVMHFSIFAGFILLVLMHALDEIVTQSLFPEYASTLNPFMFLRNLFGLVVLTGISIAVYRRLTRKTLKRITAASDWKLIALISGIIISGFLLESVQILSPGLFDQMVWDYAMTDDEQEINALKAYWKKHFSIAFAPGDSPLPSPALLSEGEMLHEESCASCHSRPESAFISYPVAGFIRPANHWLEFFHAETLLRYLHILLCFAGLALLPFSKLFHMIAAPVQIAVRHSKTASGGKISGCIPPGIVSDDNDSVHPLSWDACTHCGVCSIHCSVAPVYEVMGNTAILPSEKLRMLNRFESRSDMNEDDILRLSEGSFLCTECGRCTALCPSRINLQAIWIHSQKRMKKQGLLTLHAQIAQKRTDEWEEIFTRTPQKPPLFARQSYLTDKPETFHACVQCTTCTSVCPVAAASDDPENELDFTPQQIMNLMRLQLRDLALGSRMVWQCTTCYKCQEYCPQGIPVTDVLYELKNMAAARLQPLTEEETGTETLQPETVRALSGIVKEA